MITTNPSVGHLISKYQLQEICELACDNNE